MFIKVKRGWEIPEREATSEHVFFNRRQFLTAGAMIGAVTALSACDQKQEARADASAKPAEADPSASLYPFKRNETYKLDRDVTSADWATNYNNYYEFSSGKQLADLAQALPVRPWTLAI
ncbi:MAG TPA: protein-methionine-sulfoxide reductase catalytic subunit MsrP, partial [Dongiaceae bacterium]